MKGKQLMFFTVLEDIEPLLRDIEAIVDICYYKAGLLDSSSIMPYNSIFDTPNLGITFSGDWNGIDRYLVLKKTTLLNVREVPQRTGEMKFAVDQMKNLKSIELKLGGIYQKKENVIVGGRVATISEEKDSNELYKLFTTKMKKNFKRIETFYVGKEAEEKLKEGWRLLTDENSPKEYDLRYE